MTPAPHIAVVAGNPNPKPRSRTYDAALRVATRLGDRAPDVVIDVVDLGAGLLDWQDPGTEEAIASVQSAVELGASTPTRAHYLIDRNLANPDVLDPSLTAAYGQVHAARALYTADAH